MSLRASFRNPSSRYLLVTGFLSFILIGAVQAMYGPAFPLFRDTFGVSTSQVGLTVSLHFFGGVISILLAGLLIERFGYRRVLSGSILVMALGSLGVALSPNWPTVLASALVLGFGFGGVDIGLNILFGQSFGTRGAAALNLLNAMFGLGAVLGPLLIALFLPVGLLWPFLLVALASALLVLRLWRIETPAAGVVPSQASDPQLLLTLFGFISFYFLYVGIETGTGSWAATHLASVFSEKSAAGITSVFWGTLMLGRLLAAPISIHLKPPHLVIGASLMAVLAFAICHFIAAAPYGYALAGLFLAPIFPTGLAWLQSTFPRRAAKAISLVVASASMGGVVFPPLIGVIVDWTTVGLIPTSLMVLSMACAAAAFGLWMKTR